MFQQGKILEKFADIGKPRKIILILQVLRNAELTKYVYFLQDFFVF